MDFYISAFIPPFSDKHVAFKSPMQATLANLVNQALQPRPWCRLVQQHDQQGNYKVVLLSHHKRRPALPTFQQEFITLQVVDSTNEHAVPAHVRICRHMGQDSVTVLDPNAAQESDVVQLRSIQWTEHNVAPPLAAVLYLVLRASERRLAYSVFNASCYGFATAIFDGTHDVYGGTVNTDDSRFFTRRSHFLCLFSSGMREAPEWTRDIARDLQDLPRFNTAIGLSIASMPEGIAWLQAG